MVSVLLFDRSREPSLITECRAVSGKGKVLPSLLASCCSQCRSHPNATSRRRQPSITRVLADYPNATTLQSAACLESIEPQIVDPQPMGRGDEHPLRRHEL